MVFNKIFYGVKNIKMELNIKIHDFITDSKNSMKLTDLMSKYNLSLYQIRELRKQYDLKTK